MQPGSSSPTMRPRSWPPPPTCCAARDITATKSETPPPRWPVVSEGHYDLLITDLEMPGNADLQLVRDVGERSGGLPVIILTGYPSVRSAVASIELPVAAYLTKPVSFPLLLEKVQKAVARFRSYQVMQSTEDRLRRMRQEIGDTRSVAQDGNAVDVFLALTLRNVMGSLTDLQQLSRALNNAPTAQTPCQLLNCPRGPAAAAGGEGHGRRAGGDEGRLQVEDARRPPSSPRTAAGACVTRDERHLRCFVTVQALACPAACALGCEVQGAKGCERGSYLVRASDGRLASRRRMVDRLQPIPCAFFSFRRPCRR